MLHGEGPCQNFQKHFNSPYSHFWIISMVSFCDRMSSIPACMHVCVHHQFCVCTQMVSFFYLNPTCTELEPPVHHSFFNWPDPSTLCRVTPPWQGENRHILPCLYKKNHFCFDLKQTCTQLVSGVDLGSFLETVL